MKSDDKKNCKTEQPAFQDRELLLSAVEPLLAWYRKGHRELPWREDRNPYRIWVSEIMLQQTRVEAVKPYFLRFMEAFPTVEDLAEADDERLLKYWEGLGYYSRIRNMKKAAVIMKNQFQSQMPHSYAELLALPGIGSYTAGAVASIAFGEAVPAVDGNVLRILSRLRMDERNVSVQAVKKAVEQELKTVMPASAPGDFNQAMMELGATVCIPAGAALCENCPWQAVCRAHAHHCEDSYPKKNRKKERTVEEYTVLILKDGSRVALQKRPDRGLLANMYELPMLKGNLTEREVLKELKTMGLAILRIKKLESAKHVFTHKEWHMTGYMVYVDELEKMNFHPSEDFIYVLPEETRERYPIPSAFKAYAKYIHMTVGNDVFREQGE